MRVSSQKVGNFYRNRVEQEHVIYFIFYKIHQETSLYIYMQHHDSNYTWFVFLLEKITDFFYVNSLIEPNVLLFSLKYHMKER